MTDVTRDDSRLDDLTPDDRPRRDPDLDPATNAPFDHGINISRDGSTGPQGTTSVPGPGGTTRVLTTDDELAVDPERAD